MNWLLRYRIRHFSTNSIWLYPSLSLLAALVAVRLTYRIDEALGLESRFGPETMRTLLGTVAGSMFTIVVFVCSALLIAVQLASAQLTPRIIAFVFRDPVTRLSLTLFSFTFTYSLAVLIRINDRVPLISTHGAAYLFVVNLVVFLILIDHVGKTLRPSGALQSVSSLGRAVIEEVYSRRLAESPEDPTAPAPVPSGENSRTVLSSRDGAILAFDIHGLRELAERTDCIIEMVPQVGDYIAIGDPLFRVYGGRVELTAEQLSQSVAFGLERTPEQDPTFAFRILVDVASKALSPAINDPTTAVLALDQIHHLLRNVGGRCLDDERIRDKSGRLRLVYRTPDWECFVRLAVTEIRHFGGESIQIARRLRAMLENLIRVLAPERAPVLIQELKLLNRSAERFFVEPEDRAVADISDLQGMGGRSGDHQLRPPSETAASS